MESQTVRADDFNLANNVLIRGQGKTRLGQSKLKSHWIRGMRSDGRRLLRI